MPEVPEPESLAPLYERLEPWKERADRLVRPAPPHRPAAHRRAPVALTLGKRASRFSASGSGQTGSSPTTHSSTPAWATYASDMSLFDTVLAPHDTSWDDPEFMGASLDHCMWFHQPFRADAWLLDHTDSPIAAQGRGLARGFLFDRGGAPVRLARSGRIGPVCARGPAR